jgi:uncharacterized membrane protein
VTDTTASTSTPAENQDDEREGGRLFGLSDAVFAIAMTLLALDLRVPGLGDHPADHTLVRALLDQGPQYLAFLLSFYVIAGYWQRHKAEMRTAKAGDPALVRCTLPLLLAVCTLPFAADLLGTYGGQDGIAITVYAGVNVVAVCSLLGIRYTARKHQPSGNAGSASDYLDIWLDLGALLLAAPSGYLFPSHGPLVLVALLLLSDAAGQVIIRLRKQQPAQETAETPPEQDATANT